MAHRIRLHELRIACLPFVTRALRGTRRRRLWMGAGLLALLVVLVGTWLSRSPGDVAREARVDLGLEQGPWERSELEFTIFADSDREARSLARRQSMSPTDAPEHWEIREVAERGWVLLDTAANPHEPAPPQHQALQEQARRLRDANIRLAPEDLVDRRQWTSFSWHRPEDVTRLQAVVTAELRPHVVRYVSPLDAATTVRVIGMLAAALVLLASLVLAPLWVAVGLAQELHENTLQPLTGTALTAQQLVIGLVVGAITPLAIVVGPLVLVHLGAAAIAGRIVPALGMVGMSLAMSAMLVGLAMLVALAVGRRHAPGLVGIGLLAVLGLAAAVATAAGLHVEPEVLGAVTVLPGAGPVHLAAEAFAPVHHLSAANARVLDLRLALASIGAVVLAVVIARAIARGIAGTHRDGALRPREARAAAFVLVALALAAVPHARDYGETLLATIAIALLPLQLVLLGRVPGGDVPATLRRLPVGAILVEHAQHLAIAPVLVLLLVGLPTEIRPGLIFGAMHLGWALVVTALVTVRMTLPTTIPSKLWLMVCLGFAFVEYATGTLWCLGAPGGRMLFPLVAITPVLGLVHVGMFAAIPIALLRAIVPASPVLGPMPTTSPEPAPQGPAPVFRDGADRLR